MESNVSPPFVPYEGNEPYIFISYSHKNKEKVFDIIKKLNDKGCNIWYDEGIDPGTERWAKDIAVHLKNATLVLLFMSSEAAKSEWVNREMNYSVNNKIPLIITILYEMKLSVELEFVLTNKQKLFYYTYPNDQVFLDKLISSSKIFKKLIKKLKKQTTEEEIFTENINSNIGINNKEKKVFKIPKNQQIYIIIFFILLFVFIIIFNNKFPKIFDKSHPKNDVVVTFDSNGGSNREKMNVEIGSIYGTLGIPFKEGYIFDGWYDENGNPITNESIVTINSNHILEAKWIPKTLTVTLINSAINEPFTENGNPVKITVTFGEKYGDCGSATREGYIFDGWYDENGNFITSESIVTISSNHILIAKWIKQ